MSDLAKQYSLESRYWEYVVSAQEELKLGICVPMEMARLQVIIDELLVACEAAIAALDSAALYTTGSGCAAIWALCNGYEGSPDIRAIVAKRRIKSK